MLMSLDIAGSNCGFSIWHEGKIIDCGVVKTEKTKQKWVAVSDDNFRRATTMNAGLAKVIEKHKPAGVIGELPSGSKSATASKLFGIATGVVASICNQFSLPAEFCPQQAVKLAACGRKDASKDDIINVVVERMCFESTEKRIPITKGKQAGKETVQRTIYAIGMKFPAMAFEHIADSVAVYWALKNNNLVRMFG